MTNESELKFESFSKNDGIEFETGDKGLKNPSKLLKKAPKVLSINVLKMIIF